MERNPTRLGTGKEKVVVVGGVRNSGNFFFTKSVIGMER